MENEKQKFSWVKRYVKLPFLCVVAYSAFILFFNENSIARSFELNQVIDSLENEIKFYRDTTNHYIYLNEQLNTNPEAMERVVREKYHMNRTNEDVYVFVEEDE